MKRGLSVAGKEAGFAGHLRVRQARGTDFETLRRWVGEGGSPSIRMTGELFAPGGRSHDFEETLNRKVLHLIILEKYESGKWFSLGAVIANRMGDIHLVLDPSFRGRGLSVPAIRAAVGYLYEYPLVELKAPVESGDEVSRRAFEEAGFTCRGLKSLEGVTCLEYVRQMKVHCPIYNVFI
ncbi:MAG TPA: GNAT family protein [Syntrophales bacterium]|nr:GNAT family protein [Syntrophales bacterium]HOX94704.1 GNAT family protein [Syntrophales bacterium]HPI58125.1 GNAT family protein [Syntrophales bacterium]HPN24660.1 GNAT family protein [Syntrophales bacterium]HQM28965.1 GNAT family protein [Syntrophales bacterium]